MMSLTVMITTIVAVGDVKIKAASTQEYISEQLLPTNESTFEASYTMWDEFQTGRSELTTDVKLEGEKSLKYTGRTQEWHSPCLNIYNIVKAKGSGKYVVTFWVSVDNIGEDDFYGRMVVRGNKVNSFIGEDNVGNIFSVIGRRYVAKRVDDETNRVWYKMSGSFDVANGDILKDTGKFSIMLDQLPVSANQTIYIDNVCLYRVYNGLQSNKSYYIKNKQSGKYLSVNSAGTVVQRDYGEDIKPWKYVRNQIGDLLYYDNGTEVLTPMTSAIADSALTTSALNTSSLNQRFDIEFSGDGITYVIRPHTLDLYGISLTLSNYYYSSGTVVKIRRSARNAQNNETNDDCWYFEPANEYSRENSIAYAVLNYDNYDVDTYANLDDNGGDCANFVSQALVAGGKSMDASWHSTKLTSTRVSTNEQLATNWDFGESKSWISANKFMEYWKDRATSYEQIDINDAIIYSKQCAEKYPAGDAISLAYSGMLFTEAKHTVFITGVTQDVVNGETVKTLAVTYHSTTRLNMPLTQLAQRMRDNQRRRCNCIIIYNMS